MLRQCSIFLYNLKILYDSEFYYSPCLLCSWSSNDVNLVIIDDCTVIWPRCMYVIESTPSRAVVKSNIGSSPDKDCTFACCDCSIAVTEYLIEDGYNECLILTNYYMDNQQLHSMNQPRCHMSHSFYALSHHCNRRLLRENHSYLPGWYIDVWI